MLIGEIEGYDIVRELAAGKCWLAVRRGEFDVAGASRQRVVLKMLPEDCLLDGRLQPAVRQRLERIREIAHPQVANLLGVERHGQAAVMVWEYVDGVRWDEAITKTASTDALSAMKRNFIRSLRELHAQGLVHGAVAPGNVIVSRESVFLTDLSPLLYTDPQDDLRAAEKMIGFDEATGADEDEAAGQEGTIRRRSLFAAGAAALAGAVVAAAFWW